MNPRTIQARAKINAALATCSAPRCGGKRLGASRYCQPHQRAVRHHGHPLGKHVYPSEYRPCLSDVRALFRENPNHPGKHRANAFLGAWAARAAHGEGAPAGSTLSRLHEQRVSASDMTDTLCAVWLYSMRHPVRLPGDVRLDFALANALFALAPRKACRVYFSAEGQKLRKYPPIPKAHRQQAGAYVRDHMCSFLDDIAGRSRRSPREGTQSVSLNPHIGQ